MLQSQAIQELKDIIAEKSLYVCLKTQKEFVSVEEMVAEASEVEKLEVGEKRKLVEARMVGEKMVIEKKKVAENRKQEMAFERFHKQSTKVEREMVAQKAGTSASQAVAAGDEDQNDSRSRTAADDVVVHRNPNNQNEARVTTNQKKIQLVRTRAEGRDRVSKDADGGDEDQIEDSPGTGVHRPRTLDKRKVDG